MSLANLGFPFDRLWLGKGFNVIYKPRAPWANGGVRIAFLPRK